TGKIRARDEVGTFQQTRQTFYFEPEGDVLPFFRRNRLGFNNSNSQVVLTDRTTNDERWSHTLPRQNAGHLNYLNWNQQGNTAQMRFPYLVQGHLAVFSLGTMVYGLDLLDHKVLWELPLVGAEGGTMNQLIPDQLGGVRAMYADGRME